MDAPIPLDAPVTIATLPPSFLLLLICLFFLFFCLWFVAFFYCYLKSNRYCEKNLLCQIGNDFRESDVLQAFFHRFLCFAQGLIQSFLDVAAHRARLLTGVGMDRESLRCSHGLVNIQQGNLF